MSGLNAAAAVRTIAKGLRPVALTWRWYDYAASGGGRWLPADAGHETPGVEITDTEGFVGWCPIDGMARLCGNSVREWLSSGPMPRADVELAVRLEAEAASAPKVKEGARKVKSVPRTLRGMLTSRSVADGWHAYSVNSDGRLLVRQPCSVVYLSGFTVRWPANPVILGRARLSSAAHADIRPKGWSWALSEKPVTVTIDGDGAGTISCNGAVRRLDGAKLEPGVGSPVTVTVPTGVFLNATDTVPNSRLELAVVRRGASLWLYMKGVHEGYVYTWFEAYLSEADR